MKVIDLILIAQEIVVGRMVLDLPKEDLKKINEMIKRNLVKKDGQK
jgi:hypothetical protein